MSTVPRNLIMKAAMASILTLPLAFISSPAWSKDDPKEHGGTPAASYTPSLQILGQIKVESPGRKPGDPVISDDEFHKPTKIYFERC